MSTRLLRWGLLSTARVTRHLVPAIRASVRSRLFAVASRSLDRATRFAEAWEVPVAYGRYEDLIHDPAIDVVYNALPNTLHAEWTIKACEAGKHVLCEKPLALSAAEVEAIARAAAAHGCVVTEGFMFRHHPQTALVRELITADTIGPVRLIRSSFTFPLADTANIRLDPALGGGCLWDVGCYPVNWARTIAGVEATEVFGWATFGATGVDVSFTGQLRFSDELVAQFDCGFGSPFRTAAEIVGTAGVLRVASPFKPPARGTVELVAGERHEVITTDEQAPYVGEVDDIVAAVLDARPPGVSLDDSRWNAATLSALAASAQRGRAVASLSR